MATLKLLPDNDYDFILIGISSNMPDYRICWAVNNALLLQLVKVENYALLDKQKKVSIPDLFEKNHQSSFSHYMQEDQDTFCSFHILSNIGTGVTLVPEHKKVNYLFLIKGPITKTEKREMLETLNALSLVASAYEIEVTEINSKKNLMDIFNTY